MLWTMIYQSGWTCWLVKDYQRPERNWSDGPFSPSSKYFSIIDRLTAEGLSIGVKSL